MRRYQAKPRDTLPANILYVIIYIIMLLIFCVLLVTHVVYGQSVTVVVGDTAVIPCRISGTFTYPGWSGPPNSSTYTYENNPTINPNLANTDRLSYNTDQRSIDIANISISDTGVFSCYKNVNGVLLTASVTLEVRASITIVTNTSSMSAIYGSTIRLTCTVNPLNSNLGNLEWFISNVKQTDCDSGSDFCLPDKKENGRLSFSSDITNGKFYFDIQNIKSTDVSTYKCEQGASSGSIVLEVVYQIESVTMTSPTADTVTVVQNTDTPEFVCVTSAGLPRASISFQLNDCTTSTNDDVNITSSASSPTFTTASTGLITTTARLTYRPSKTYNDWRVYCTASNTAGLTRTSSRKPALNVQYIPVVQLQPFQTAIQSNLFSSVCNTTHGNPEETTYTWTRDIDNWSQNTRNMTLPLVKIGDIGSYTCRAENIVGSSSGSFAMDVLYGPSKPVMMCHHCAPISVLDQEVRIVEGANLHITCNNSTSKPGPSSYNWSGTLDSPSYSLELDHVSRTQTGNVICHVKNLMQGTFATVTGHNNKTVLLNVLYKPIVHAIADATKVNGTNVTVPCLLTPGNPAAATYRWTRSQDGWIQTTNTMTVTNIQMEDTGVYTCTVQNIMDPTGHGLVSGEDSKSFTLTVLSDKEQDQSKNSNVEVKVDDSNQEPSHYYNVGTESVSEAQHSTYESLEPTTEEPDNYSQLHNIELQGNSSVTTNQ